MKKRGLFSSQFWRSKSTVLVSGENPLPVSHSWTAPHTSEKGHMLREEAREPAEGARFTF
jgi:hypothetical protein